MQHNKTNYSRDFVVGRTLQSSILLYWHTERCGINNQSCSRLICNSTIATYGSVPFTLKWTAWAVLSRCTCFEIKARAACSHVCTFCSYHLLGTKTTLKELYYAINKQENAHPVLVAGDFNAGNLNQFYLISINMLNVQPEEKNSRSPVLHTQRRVQSSPLPSIWQIWP